MRIKYKQITFWLDPECMMDTQYGKITAQEWLDAELFRITQNRNRKRTGCIRINNSGKIALFSTNQSKTPNIKTDYF